MFTMEMLMRLSVVAAYQMYDSLILRSFIHPDQRTKQMMQKAISVSMARNSFDFPKRRPTWAIVQNSIGDLRPAVLKATTTRFIIRSADAQRMINKPKITKGDCGSVPALMLKAPKRSLKMQKGIPIVSA